MPTRGTAAKKETWDDWLPADRPGADRYLTIDELIGELQEFGIHDVEPSDIRYWQMQNVLPYPIKRWHDGATRALYPQDATLIIFRLRELQKRGYTLRQITDRLRAWAAIMHDPDPHGIAPALIELAQRQAELTRRPIRYVQIHFIDEDGSEQAYSYDVPLTDSTKYLYPVG